MDEKTDSKQKCEHMLKPNVPIKVLNHKPE